jgi:hypothetical protein
MSAVPATATKPLSRMRRPLLFIGVTGMTIALMMLGIAFLTAVESTSPLPANVTAAPASVNTTAPPTTTPQ